MTKDAEGYFKQATDWSVDQHTAQRASLRFARLVGLLAVAVAGLEAIALILLLPQRSVTAVPILVDRQSGYIEVLKPDGRKAITSNDALTRSLVARYVTDREHFDIADLNASYQRVALWSADGARRDYLALMPASNPASPIKLFPRGTIVNVRIKTISPVGQQVALVRFETTRREPTGAIQKAKAWAATVSYRFNDRPMRFEDRLINPLGFEVTHYRLDPESLPDPEPVGPQAANRPSETEPDGSTATPEPQL